MLKRRMTLLLLMILMGCAQEDTSDGDNALAIYTPEFLLESREIEQENYKPILTIDNTTHVLTKSGNQWVGTFYVPRNDSYEIKVDWYELYKGRQLQIASASKSIQVGSAGVSAEIASADYETDRFDADGDNQSNLVERNSDTNPFVHQDIESTAFVEIPRLPANQSTPTIDGVYAAEEWQYATGKNKSGQELTIKNLLLTEDAGADVSTQINRWYGVHDGNYLYLLIFSNDQTRTNDSVDAWDDDNLNLYLDGDYSHYRGYDGVNDFHILIPLLKRNSSNANVSGTSNARIQQGVNSVTIPGDMFYATGVGAGPSGNRGTKMDVYEVKISLAQTSIKVGKLFGMDIHLDDDDDGGSRDSKWGWYLNSDDLSYQFTDEFAAIVLEQ